MCSRYSIITFSYRQRSKNTESSFLNIENKCFKKH